MGVGSQLVLKIITGQTGFNPRVRGMGVGSLALVALTLALAAVSIRVFAAWGLEVYQHDKVEVEFLFQSACSRHGGWKKRVV